MSSPHTQASLFGAVDPSPAPAAVDTSNQNSAATAGTEPLARELSTDELIESLLRSMATNRRWERQRLLGATDDQLAGIFGNCHVGGGEFTATFKALGEPAVICCNRAGEELFTLSRAEMSERLRPIAGIPQPGSQEETERLLNGRLEQERVQARRDAVTRIQHLLGEKLRKGQQGLASCIVPLLFVEDCFSEPVEKQTLEAITRLLLTHGRDTLSATKAAINIVEYAHHTWQSVENYWLDRRFNNLYQTPTAKGES